MSDRIAIMLDNMIIAVDEGFSYDGIVSIPETGLEDVSHRRDLVSWLNSCVNVFRKAVKTFLQTATGVFRNEPRDDQSSSNSRIRLVTLPPSVVRDPPSMQDSSSAQDRLPTQEPPSTRDPRSMQDPLSEQDHSSARDAASTPGSPFLQGSLSPQHISAPQAPSNESEQGLTHTDQRLPRLRSRMLGDTAHINVDQNRPMPTSEEGRGNQAGLAGKERMPRKREEESSKSGQERELGGGAH